MIPGYNNLTEQEKETLLSAPVVVSILAAISDDGMVDEEEREEAERMAKFKPYTIMPALQDYYLEVQKNFSKNFDNIFNDLPENEDLKKSVLREKLSSLRKVLPKLPREHAEKLVESLKSFAVYVFKTNSSVLQYFLIPILAKELGEQFN